MTPVRETFWNIPHWAELAQYLLGFLTVVVFVAGVYLRVRRWRLGRPERLSGSLRDRLQAVATYALAQLRILTDRFSGTMHLALFWGMVMLFLGTVLATVDWDVTRLLLNFQFLRGSFYLGYELVLDVSGAVVVIGLAMGLWRRYVRKVPRLASQTVPTFTWDDTYLLGILLLIVVSGFLVEGLRISVHPPSWRVWSPIGSALAEAFRPMPVGTLRVLHVSLWAAHGLLAFIFIASIPFTKAFHLISSPLNVFLRDFSPPGVLKAGAEAGVCAVTDFSWKQLLELDACTWCGRCQDVCPAYVSGRALSPKHLIMKLDARLLRHSGRRGGNPTGAARVRGAEDPGHGPCHLLDAGIVGGVVAGDPDELHRLPAGILPVQA